jgi:hypothetical protein
MNDTDSQRYRANLQGEIDGAAVYRALASSETDPKLAEVFRRLAAVEEGTRRSIHWRARSSASIPRSWAARPGRRARRPSCCSPWARSCRWRRSFFLTGAAAFVTSLAAGATVLMAIGVGTSLFTGRSMVFSALRQLLIGAAAAGITYGVGKVVGVSLG